MALQCLLLLLRLLLACAVLLPPLPAAAADAASSSSSSSSDWLVMIDAGSTGSRVHVHSYRWAAGAALPAIDPSVSVKVKPGLSSFADSPRDAAASIAELVDKAKQTVPRERWASTPIHLQATAGLRSVREQQARDVLAQVRQGLRQSGFLFQDDWALIISGEQEGINGWLATNLLLGALEPDSPLPVHGVVEMGGASMQITFSPSSAAALLPTALTRLAHLSLCGRSYYLYTHSYLAYGLQAAQKLYQSLLMEEIEDSGNPCYPVGLRFTSRGNFDACYRLMEKVVDRTARCELEPCAFNGVWQPAVASSPFLAIENFFYTFKFFASPAQAADSLLINDVQAGGNLLVATLKAKGREYCDDSWEQILRDHAADIEAKREDATSLSYYCFAAAYEAAVLEKGFGFGERSNIRPARTIERKSIDWELGASLLEILSSRGVHVMRNPQVTAWTGQAGLCGGWLCRLSLLLVLALSLSAALLCYRRVARASPVQRGYSMLSAASAMQGGGGGGGLFKV